MNKKIFIISLVSVIVVTTLFVIFINNKNNNNDDIKNNKLVNLKANIANDDERIASYKTKIYNSNKISIENSGMQKNVSKDRINFYKNAFLKATWKEKEPLTCDWAPYCYISFDDLDIEIINDNILTIKIEKHFFTLSNLEDGLPEGIKPKY